MFWEPCHLQNCFITVALQMICLILNIFVRLVLKCIYTLWRSKMESKMEPTKLRYVLA